MTTSRHGSRARYVAGCGCAPCTSAHSAYNATRKRQAAYGRPTTDLIDAEAIRTHLRALVAAGMGARAIAAASGVGRRRIQELIKEPEGRVKPETAAALLAVTVALPDHALVDAAGTHRRLQALVERGWAMARLAERLSMTPANFSDLLRRDQVTAATARRVTALYDELWDQAPPEGTPLERKAASMARRIAGSRGWLPPAAWDDDLIDVPEDDLEAEITRRVDRMDEAELRSAHTSWRKYGDRSPLTVAAGREYARLVYERKTAA
ncbi:hypothetical protein [Nocardiopsis tropica]|uniref:Helix-turn-helix domain-containing protein n=1 Tax=Nocardiopsis tropica TaxID=109330 RepID=A0ABU7KR17_9ACTN|nr:hypothetical protein [Nocardiopsis umidischolae]MEE2051724.1 hypothetical protein [Nocardiopsis umidischolae]